MTREWGAARGRWRSFAGPQGRTRTRSGGPALYAIGADGRGLRRLTPLGVYGYAWSPDGSRIAYHDSRGSLVMVRRDGTGRTRVGEQSKESTKFVASWIRDEKLDTMIPNEPKITSGKVVAHSDRVLVAA